MLCCAALAGALAAPARAASPAIALEVPRNASATSSTTDSASATAGAQASSTSASVTESATASTGSTTTAAVSPPPADTSATASGPAAPASATSGPGANGATGPTASGATGPTASGATGPTASGSAAVAPDDGTVFASGSAHPGGAAAPASAAASGAAPAKPAPGATIAASASGIAASVQAAVPPYAFQGVLALTDPFASLADSVLGYFRIPLFLLPIYQAAADQYGVPWPVLAAINEIETDYGHDLNVSPAGALGWMQFMPTTWLRYGVDATASGVADPYNPADAVFAAARYLRDAGARRDLAGAIFAYNHSSAYVASVLLRAQLIETYPASLIDSLTSLSIGDTPVHDVDVHAVDFGPRPRAVRVPAGVGTGPVHAGGRRRPATTAVVGAAPITLVTTPGARVLAVRDSRVVREGVSPALGGAYLTLRDADGNLFTYGHLSRRAVYGPEHPPRWHPLGVGAAVTSGAVIGEVGGTESTGLLRFVLQPAGDREPVDALPYLDSWALRAETLHLRGSASAARLPARAALAATGPLAPVGPGASASRAASAGPVASDAAGAGRRARAAAVARARAASDLFTWGGTSIFFATAGELEHMVLADRRVALAACERAAVSAHRVDRRALAVLEFLSQSGFSVAVGRAGCATPSAPLGGAPASVRRARSTLLDITQVNGAAVAARPGSDSLTALVLARLRALYGEFVPESVLDVPETAARATARGGGPHGLHIAFAAAGTPAGKPPAPVEAAAARVPALDAPLTTLQWARVTARLAAIHNPRLVVFPSSSATVDAAAGAAR